MSDECTFELTWSQLRLHLTDLTRNQLSDIFNSCAETITLHIRVGDGNYEEYNVDPSKTV